MERIAKKTYLGDYPMHFLVGRSPHHNTPELLELVKLFFLKDHQMNCRNKLGSTPLHRACAAGNLQMANELIRWGAEVDAVNDMQLTCLHMACLSGSADVVKLLLENGCAKHINFKCLYGIAPVDYVLKDDVIALLRAARKGAATNAPAPTVKPVGPAKITEGNEEEAE
jgi:ankyrin repeat protein